MRILLLALAGLALAGCARVTDSTPDGVTVAYVGSHAGDAVATATAYCQQSGKTAALQSISPNAWQNIATFNCNK